MILLDNFRDKLTGFIGDINMIFWIEVIVIVLKAVFCVAS